MGLRKNSRIVGCSENTDLGQFTSNPISFIDAEKENRSSLLFHSAGLMSTTGVPSIASIGPIRRRFLTILRIVTG